MIHAENAALCVVVLAAGQGKRMVSSRPKVLHSLGGKPMLAHVLVTAQSLDASDVLVVHGHGGAQVWDACGAGDRVRWVEQAQQLGTGHALAQALPHIDPSATVLVLYGDVPLIRSQTLKPLLDAAGAGHLGLLTVELPDPRGYGRIIRDTGGKIQRIVEERDADPAQCQINESNTGIMAVKAEPLSRWLGRIGNDNDQGEFYLTDVVAMAVADGVPVVPIMVQDQSEVLGVNDRLQLAKLERALQRRHAESLMRHGVTVIDPERLDVRGQVVAGRDCVIDVNVVFEGRVELADRVVIGPNCVIRDSRIGADSQIFANCVLEGATVADHCQVGPFARLRPDADLRSHAKAGNFVEIKKAVVGEASKVNHLSYIGDARIGSGVNVGAGTITCNYDGANKHLTVIGDDAFIGSNTALVAPVTVGEGSTVGAGSTICGDVQPEALAVTRAPQRTIPNWRRPTKKR